MAKGNAEGSEKKLVSRREFLVGSGAVMAAIALTACSKTTNPTTVMPESVNSTPLKQTSTPPFGSTLTPKYGGVLKMLATSSSITSLGWAAEGQGQLSAPDVCLERLLRSDNKGNLTPWLAESYKVADDLKSMTFNLRRGVKFHDGSDFNAEVVKWNLDNYINAKMEVYWASVDIVDDYTVRVNFTEWKNNLPSLFDSDPPLICMVSKVAFDKHGKDWMRFNPVGTGPFKFESFDRDVSENYVRNPDYWMKGKPYLDKIRFIYVADQTTQKVLAESGEGDVVAIVQPGKKAADYAALGFTIRSDMNANEILVGDSAHADSVWANKKVREAVEYAIDREAMAKGLGYGYLQAPYQIPPRNSLVYDPGFPLARKYDPEKAKQLLTEAGYPDGLKTTIILEADGNRDLAIAMQASLAKVGIQVNLEFPQMSTWGSYVGADGAWHNAAIICPCPSTDPYFSFGLQFMNFMWGQNWLRTPEVTQAYQASLTSPTADVQTGACCYRPDY